jgi:hypothetical protein
MPVALPPFRRPSWIDSDDPQADVGGHADQQVPELPSRHARHGLAEDLAAPATPERLPADLAGVGEVQVLDSDRAAAVRLGEVDQRGDRLAQPPVADAGRLPGKRQRDGARRADRVPERIRQLVYVDSGPIADGQSYLDLLDPDARAREERRIAERGDGLRWPVPSWSELEEFGASLVGLGDRQRRLFAARAVPHPAGTITQPIRLANPARRTPPTLLLDESTPR